MKSIMTRLRIHFQLNKTALDDYLSSYGFKNSNEELSFLSYFDFLKVVSPTISEEEAIYIFKKTDIDGNGFISLD
jgi:Ca2+-binding EF-hand superfamily protein